MGIAITKMELLRLRVVASPEASVPGRDFWDKGGSVRPLGFQRLCLPG